MAKIAATLMFDLSATYETRYEINMTSLQSLFLRETLRVCIR